VTRTRVDAVRNRASVLQATAELLAKDGAAALRVADVAAVAGVGAGTIYRGFGSKSGLLLALLDERERVLQEALIRGDPPLGPGASAEERLVAFVLALHDLTLAERDVIVASERSATSRYETGAYRAWHAHAALLLREAGVPDPPTSAHTLLAPLDAGLYRHLVDDGGIDAQRIRDALGRSVRTLASVTA
jgi:AcrR family transcriptional regulator